jgi:hypothetical protein
MTVLFSEEEPRMTPESKFVLGCCLAACAGTGTRLTDSVSL